MQKKQKADLSIAILITTMNQGIDRVISHLLPQLQDAEQIIIAHQITDPNFQAQERNFPQNVVYVSMQEKGLSKNRNHALAHATADICYICDDDLTFLPNAIQTIKNAYRNSDADVITFQAIDEHNHKHFQIKAGKHTPISVLRVRSRGITFKRKKILNAKISFQEDFGLWAKYCVGEENIFLTECYQKGLKMLHSDAAIVFHPLESSGITYENRADLITARIKVFKKIYGILGGILGGLYIAMMHYKLYKKYFRISDVFKISRNALWKKD